MKNQEVADQYNKIYSADEKAFGGEPAPIVRLLTKYLPAGEILDIGAGAGANALFLASRGYRVRATDISSLAVERLARRAREIGATLQTSLSDIAEEDLDEDYDAIICMVVLHHLTREDAGLVIRKMQQHTKPLGINLITTFTKRGDFFRNRPDTLNFYIDDLTHLERLYAGWKIVESFEKEGPARALNTEGKPQLNVFAGLMAQKI